MSQTVGHRSRGMSITWKRVSLMAMAAGALLLDTAPVMADVKVDVGFFSRSRGRGHCGHHCRPRYYHPFWARPVVVAPRPVIVEREVIVQQPVRYWQTPVVQQVQPVQTIQPVQPVQPPQQLAPAHVEVPAPSAQVPLSSVPIKFEGQLPAGPTKAYTVTQPYTNVNFSVPVPAMVEPRKVDYDKREIELKYENGEIEIEFKRDGSVKVEYDF